jgi:hypothetical protein
MTYLLNIFSLGADITTCDSVQWLFRNFGNTTFLLAGDFSYRSTHTFLP